MLRAIQGHQKIKDHLEKAIQLKTVNHAYLFSGMDGIGKKKLAIEFAKTLLCKTKNEKPCQDCRICNQIEHENHPDVKLITLKEGESRIKISRIREMISDLSIMPYEGNKRIVIIDDADKMTTEAQNSLLKSLEEPLEYNLFILLTSHPQGILNTIQSRCQSYVFQPLDTQIVRHILEKEYNREAVNDVLGSAGGSPGIGRYLLENLEIQKERKHFLRELYLLIKGDGIKVFSLAEVLAKDKKFSEEMLNFFIQWFYEVDLLLNGLELSEKVEENQAHRAYCGQLDGEKNQLILKTLFEMMETIHYNISLRLQWENTLIKIMKIQKG